MCIRRLDRMWSFVRKMLKQHHRYNLKRKTLKEWSKIREISPEKRTPVKRRRVQEQSTRWSDDLPFDVLQRILLEIGDDRQGKRNVRLSELRSEFGD